jgi:hypothetical protein
VNRDVRGSIELAYESIELAYKSIHMCEGQYGSQYTCAKVNRVSVRGSTQVNTIVRGSIGLVYASQYNRAMVNTIGVHVNTLERGSIGSAYASQYTCRVGVQGNRSIGLVYTGLHKSIRMCEGQYKCARVNRIGVHVNTNVRGSIGSAYASQYTCARVNRIGVRKSIGLCKGQ